MGIIQRFKDIMSSNINAVLDKMEDPEKMIDQYMRNLQEDLKKVKEETASVMAEETRAKRELDECDAEIAKLQKFAEKAIMAGNDGDAKTFLTQKSNLNQKREALAANYELAASNATKMRQMHDKLISDMSQLEARKETIKAKMKLAQTQEKLNKIGESIGGAQSSLDAFSRMEAKANKMLDKANAMSELNKKAETVDMNALKEKYESASSAEVDDELAALKAKLGK